MHNIEISWTDFKAFLTENINYQYFEISNTYYLFYNNGPIVCLCKIFKDSGADQTDFETNYKSLANKEIKQRVVSEPADLSITNYNASDVVEVDAGEEVIIDLVLAQVGEETTQILYGGAIYTKDADFSDHVKFQIVDVNNVLGYGNNIVLKEYIKKAYLNNNGTFEDYDDAGASLPVGLVLRCIYKSEKETGTTKVKINYLLGIS